MIDGLSADELADLERLLAGRDDAADDPLGRFLADAPIDDEPLTAEDEAALEEAYAAVAAGQVSPEEAVWRRLGHAS